MSLPRPSLERKLRELLDLFPGDTLRPAALEIVSEEEVPPPYHKLLAHPHHMTVTLEEYHGGPVRLVILDRRHEGDHYQRRLVLTAASKPAAMQEKVVLAGIMRISLRYCQEDVRRLIIQGETPLGRILIDHNVLRWIEPEAYLRLRLDASLRKLFGAPAEARTTYGRMATIFCDNQPAVALLEILAPEVLPS